MAVNVREPPPSSTIVDAFEDNVTVGALSSLVIVNVTDCVPLSVAEPPDTLSIETIAVSSVS